MTKTLLLFLSVQKLENFHALPPDPHPPTLRTLSKKCSTRKTFFSKDFFYDTHGLDVITDPKFVVIE